MTAQPPPLGETVWVWPIVVVAEGEDKPGAAMWLPMLIAEHVDDVRELTAGGPVDLILGAYARLGMAPLPSPLWHEPPHCPDWRVTLPGGTERGRIVHADGLVLSDDLSGGQFPAQFEVAAAVNDGLCALMVTSGVGILRYRRDPMSGGVDGLLHALTDAGAAGRLLGCLATVQPRLRRPDRRPTRDQPLPGHPLAMRPRCP